MQPHDKLLLQIGGIPLLRHMAGQAQMLAHDVIIALPDLQGARFQSIFDLPCKPMHFADSKGGLSGTLRGAAHYAHNQNYSHLLCLLADLPQITHNHMQNLLQYAQGDQTHLIWQAQAQNGTAGHPIIFARSIFHDFTLITGDNGAKQIVKKHQHKRHLMKCKSNAPINDMDTPDDLTKFSNLSRP